MSSLHDEKRLYYSDEDSLDSTTTSRSTRELKPSLIIHPYPGNVARIRKLIATYKNQMNLLRDNIHPSVDGLKMLHTAACYLDLPEGNDKQTLRTDATKKQRQRQEQLRELARLRDMTERLEEVLKLVNRPDKFREKMGMIKHHILLA
ncbi:hypothetical protein EPUS_04858 [Endocarpon pusillum Z07020]|uniref:Uncharacterized protein n=1 Tax=Endocarpon pusillum (strain Z07020 / HMAS-L-300199) TaxID=1263415 RepID=U1GSU8_ENDPU|nr:uncharacterized protein EPUS_04858 [Endocarpon pusillum Z07020]ERF75076.1 hypothetical protein EPUS_04858 [Endocarpon pusillum Z07020]